MKIFENKKLTTIITAVLLVAILICAIIFIKQRNTPEYWTGYAMSTTISQTAYGKNAFDTMRLVQKGLEDFEAEMSMYKPDSDIYKLNANAGLGELALSDNAFNMLKTAQTLEKQSDGAFKITIAPVTTLWGVNTPTQNVPSEEDLHLELALLNQNDLFLNDKTKTATLAKKGEAV
ncbi:MAG: FAD:protein FMN transferase, partial [Oscillospiraceae bacterium]